jgi:hypothetical protein
MSSDFIKIKTSYQPKLGFDTKPYYSKRNAPSIIFGLFVTLVLLVPLAPVIKPYFCVLCIAIIYKQTMSRRNHLLVIPAFLIVFGIFTYGYFFSLFMPSDRAIASQYFLTIFILFLVHFVEIHRIDIDRVIEISGLVFLIGTCIFVINTFWPENPLANITTPIFKDYSFAGVDTRAQDILDSQNEIKTFVLGDTPFLFLPWSIVLIRMMKQRNIKNLILLIMFGTAILFSGSRAIIGGSIVFLMITIYGGASLYKRILTFIVLGLIMYYSVNYLLDNTMVLNSYEQSNEAKIAHIESYFDDLTFVKAMFGQGLGSYYYSSAGLGSLRSYTEITPVDMARYFGIPLTLLLYYCIIFPIYKSSIYVGENKLRMIAMILYIIMSAANPIMFNSYGMLIVVWYWIKLRETQRSCV